MGSSLKGRKVRLYDRAIDEVNWYQERKQWRSMSTTTPTSGQTRLKNRFKFFEPNNKSSFVPTMYFGEANTFILLENDRRMG